MSSSKDWLWIPQMPKLASLNCEPRLHVVLVSYYFMAWSWCDYSEREEFIHAELGFEPNHAKSLKNKGCLD